MTLLWLLTAAFCHRTWRRAHKGAGHRLDNEEKILRAETKIGYLTADYDEAVRLLSKCLETARRHRRVNDGAIHEEKTTLHALAHQAYIRGELDQAVDLFNQSMALGQQAHDCFNISTNQYHLGMIALRRGDKAQAYALFLKSVAEGNKIGLKLGNINAALELAALGIEDGKLTEALNTVRECLDDFYRIGNLDRVAHCLSVSVGIAQARNDLPRAARFLGKTAQIRRDHSTHGIYAFDMYLEYERRLPLVRAAMESAAFERAFAEGQHMSLQQAMKEALKAD